MDKWERSPMVPMAPTPHWCGQNNHPSFSSSLLDAIYRSIDEHDGGSPVLARHSDSKMQTNIKDKTWMLPSPTQAYLSRPRDPAKYRGHCCVFSTSSSSECSSIGGFSSSDADSIAPRPAPIRSDRIRSDPQPERKRPSSIRSRLRELRNMGTPASPRTRLSAFLTAIFSGSTGNTKKPKFAGGKEESKTSYDKSRNNKTPAISRFGGQHIPAKVSGDRGAARDPRMEVDEFLRRFGLEDAAEVESDCESVSSSDLFELNSLSAVGRYKDELPVYGTTSLSASRNFALRFNA